jgi:hypothetical protein
MRIITDKNRLAWMRRELLRAGEKLGSPGASNRTAKVALSLLSEG